jgi:hypothetical protein
MSQVIVQALHQAILLGDTDFVTTLLKNLAEPLAQSGEDFDAYTTFQGTSALLLACAKSNPEIVQLLLEAGADPGWFIGLQTSVKQALQNEEYALPILQLLLNDLGDNAADMVNFTGEGDMAEVGDLVLYPLELAIQREDVNLCQALLKAGADVQRDAFLSYALFQKNQEIINLLLHAGAEVDRLAYTLHDSFFLDLSLQAQLPKNNAPALFYKDFSEDKKDFITMNRLEELAADEIESLFLDVPVAGDEHYRCAMAYEELEKGQVVGVYYLSNFKNEVLEIVVALPESQEELPGIHALFDEEKHFALRFWWNSQEGAELWVNAETLTLEDAKTFIAGH